MKLVSSPYHILVFIRKFSLLLLTLPLQTTLMINSVAHTKIFFISCNLAALTAIYLCACVSRRNCILYALPSRYILCTGVFHKQKLIIPKTKLENIHVTRNILQKLLGVYKVSIVSSKAKGEIFLRKKHLAYLPCTQKEPQLTPIFKSSVTDILIVSAGLSPALGAALSFAPLLRSLSSLSAQSTVSSVNLWEVIGYKNLPPVLAVVSSALILIWLMGTILSFLRLWGLCLYKSGHGLCIKRGMLSVHTAYFKENKIKGVVFRQSLFMLLLRKKRAEFVLAAKENPPHIIAGCTQKFGHTTSILSAARVNLQQKSTPLKPPASALFSCTVLPLLSLSLLSLLCIFTGAFSPLRIEPHLAVFLVLWCCVWFLHRSLAFCRTFILLSENTFYISTASGLTLVEAFIPTPNITCAKTTRNIFQRIKGTCNLRIFIKCSRRKSFVIRHISAKKAAELTKKLCG